MSSSTRDAHIFNETAGDKLCVWLSQKWSGRQMSVLDSSDQRDTPACVISQRVARAAHRLQVTHIFSCACVCSIIHSTCTYMMEKPVKHTHRARWRIIKLSREERRGEGQRDELFNATATKWINKQMKLEMASASTTPTPDNKHPPATVSIHTHSQNNTDSYRDWYQQYLMLITSIWTSEPLITERFYHDI